MCQVAAGKNVQLGEEEYFLCKSEVSISTRLTHSTIHHLRGDIFVTIKVCRLTRVSSNVRVKTFHPILSVPINDALLGWVDVGFLVKWERAGPLVREKYLEQHYDCLRIQKLIHSRT